MNFRTSIAFALVGLFGGVACASTDAPGPAGKAGSSMSYADCQQSAEYPGFTAEDGTVYSGGRYAVEYDNGVCTVQKAG